MDNVRIEVVTQEPALTQVKALFAEYFAWVPFSLAFQDVETEMAEMPGRYAPPTGCLLGAFNEDGEALGCIALKRLEPGICEMKRLFVRPDARGLSLGRRLSERLMREARRMGYERMRLDTVKTTMKSALSLYRRLGFREIEPYYENPHPDAVFMERLLLESLCGTN